MSLKDHLYSTQLKIRQGLAARSVGRGRPVEVDPATFAPERVLFILSGLIGDSVMSLPAIAAGRGLWAGASVSVLGKRHNGELIAGCDFFDEFYECDADPFSLRRSDEIKKLEAWLAERRFDAAFILLGDQFAHLLARAGIPVRVGVRGTPLENCLTHTYEIGSPRTWGANERLNAIRCLGFEAANAVPELSVEAAASSSAREKLGVKGEYAVLHPFGSTRRQWWELDRIPALADVLLREHGLKIVLAGGKENAASVPDAVRAAVADTTGKLSLGELMAVLAGARLLITTDSGPFHIAGALGRPIVGLFRSRRPEHAGQYPRAGCVFGENAACMRGCEWDRCQSDPCRQMENITVESVVDAVRARLGDL